MSGLETVDIDQLVVPQITGVVEGRTPLGRFAPNNTICDTSSRGKGYAKISTRMGLLANEKTVAQVNELVSNIEEFGKLTIADAVAYSRLAAAPTDRADAEFLIDRIEGKPTNKTELTGKDGNPLAVMTADVTNLILEIADDMGDV